MIADGKHIAKILEDELHEKLLKTNPKKVCFILFGNDPASKKFIEMKSALALRLGIFVDVIEKEEITSTGQAVEIVEEVAKGDYDGIVVQLPLPKELDAEKILNAVPNELDIDVLGDQAKEDYKDGKSPLIPPVARAVLEILKFYKIDLSDAQNKKEVLVLGNGRLVGEPVSATFSRMGILHKVVSKDTEEAEKFAAIKSADVIVCGIGVPHFLKPEMIKQGAVIIDAGTSESEGKLTGDVDPACESVASLLTPVPGGVGPVTVLSLFANLIP